MSHDIKFPNGSPATHLTANGSWNLVKHQRRHFESMMPQRDAWKSAFIGPLLPRQGDVY